MELLDISKLGNDVSILSTDNYGNVNWHKLTNITRHDPSEYIYNIRTKWGREVSVVASKSLLIWNEKSKEFEEKNSEDVNIGDKMPLSFSIPQTSHIITHVNIRDYLSPSEYIYGTDYNQGINQCGVKKKFEIKDNYVYLKNSRRNSPCMLDKFELNKENGFFIGIYLAEGNTCKDYVGIANNDENIRNKVKEWFHKNRIINKIQVKKFNPNRPGLSTSIRGYSTILVQFLEKFLGKYSQGKYLPNETFMAPDEFIQGLIDGYISGDGCVTDYHVVVTSVSKDLIHGISHLMSRYGIFSKLSSVIVTKNNIGSKNILPRYVLSIQSKYVYKFGKLFTLTLNKKQEKLTKLIERKTLDNMSFLYEEQNDVILDKIVSIDKVLSSSNDIYKKVFDITIPSTLNFQTLNGLNIRDTSETGYIQRRLIKAMEDCKIYYDQTVRNATGAIVQYLYGEDGMDGTKIENQHIAYIGLNLIELDFAYHLRQEDPFDIHMTTEAVNEMQKDNKWIAQADKFFEDIIEDREYLIKYIFNGEKQDKIQYPIPFDRIINNCIKRHEIISKEKGAMPTDLTPQYVFDTIENLIDELKIIHENQGTRFIHILLRANLSPKQLIFEHHISKTLFDFIVSEIKRYFVASIAQPGEMVGIVAAQSIGELSTQQSVSKDSIVKIITNDGTFYNGTISEYIDKLLESHKNKVKIINNNPKSVVFTFSSKETNQIVSVTNDEKLKWARISQISRHPTNGRIMRVTTKSGRTVTATLSHSFLMRNCYGISPILGSLLKVGDHIPIAKAIPKAYVDFDYQYNNVNIDDKDDIIPNMVEVLKEMNLDIYKTKYTRNDLRELVDKVKNKNDVRQLIKLVHQAINSDVIYEEITDITYIDDPNEYVYDFTVPGSESFMVNDGIMVHNTLDSFHSSGTAAAVKATSGVPRLKELLSVSKNIKTPTLVIYMKPDISLITNPVFNADGDISDTRIQESKERSMKVMQELEITRFADILHSTEIYWDPSGESGLQTGVPDDDSILSIYRAFSSVESQRMRSQSPWVLRMKLHKSKLYRIGLTMMDVYVKIMTLYSQNIDCVFSDDNAPELIMRIRLTREALKDIDPDDAIAALKAMEYNLTHNILLKGLKGIKKVSMRLKNYTKYNKNDEETYKIEENNGKQKNITDFSDSKNQFDKVAEWILDTDGTNLSDILGNPNIDSYRTHSNDIYEVFKVLGIEAARNALFQEFMEVVGDGAINYRHMSLLLDTMTNRGTLMSVDRHGINRGDVGPLAKSSFEETTDMLINASIFSELDNINGVSANIMLGQLPPCGTGDHDVMLDEEEFERLIKERQIDITKLTKTEVDEVPDLYAIKQSCSVENVAFKYKLPKANKNIKKMPKPDISFV